MWQESRQIVKTSFARARYCTIMHGRFLFYHGDGVELARRLEGCEWDAFASNIVRARSSVRMCAPVRLHVCRVIAKHLVPV